MDLMCNKKTGKFYRVLTMVYNTENYWGFGLYPSSGFNNNYKKKKKHDVAETGSVSKGPNRIGVPLT
jgi:hypothetical protein